MVPILWVEGVEISLFTLLLQQRTRSKRILEVEFATEYMLLSMIPFLNRRAQEGLVFVTLTQPEANRQREGIDYLHVELERIEDLYPTLERTTRWCTMKRET
jgi:hypothetical protein